MSLRQKLILTALGMLAAPLAYAGSTVQNVRIWSEDDRTRIVLDLSQPAQHSIFTLRGPDRLVVDLKDSRLAEALKNLPTGGSISSIRTGVRSNGQLRVTSTRPCVREASRRDRTINTAIAWSSIYKDKATYAR